MKSSILSNALQLQLPFVKKQALKACNYMVHMVISSVSFYRRSTNKRQDQWGGSAENRMRFYWKFIKRYVRQPQSSLLFRSNLIQQIFSVVESSEEDVIATFKAIDAAGIDLIEISGVAMKHLRWQG